MREGARICGGAAAIGTPRGVSAAFGGKSRAAGEGPCTVSGPVSGAVSGAVLGALRDCAGV